MAARDTERYYWLKLHKDFFKRHDITVIEDMPNGKDYVLFYLKLMLESIDHEGALRFSDTIPYSETMLASVTHTNVDVVRSALKILTELGMVEVFDDKTLFMTEVAKLLDSETYAAKRKRLQRENEEKGDIVPRLSPVCPQEIEKEIDTDTELERDTDIGPEQKAEIITLALKDGTEYEITDDYIRKMQAAFPDVDIRKEVGKMSAWCLNNPAKRKTSRGITRFINSWLSSEQTRAEEAKKKQKKSTNNIFLEIAEERHDNR
jgi:predicted phage replisome organizer